jgi:hypothetical protein
MKVLRDVFGWGHDSNGNVLSMRNSTERSMNVFVDAKHLVLEIQRERGSNDFESVKVPIEMVLAMLEADGLLGQSDEE